MKVLVDECVDWRLSREILGHEAKTARQMGWATIRNGEFLGLAAKEFDVFVTVDRNLSFQQNLPAFAIAVLFCARARIDFLIFNLWCPTCSRASHPPSRARSRTSASHSKPRAATQKAARRSGAAALLARTASPTLTITMS